MIYLDNAATTEPSERTKNIVSGLMSEFANPSSIYPLGLDAREFIDNSRKTIAETIGAQPYEVFFTSGGSESNAMAIKGVAKQLKDHGLTHCITTRIEHSSVLGCFKQLEDDGFDVTYISVGNNPEKLPEKIAEAIRPNTGLVSVMYVNNETGMILPVREIGKMCQCLGVYFHTDCVQAFGQQKINVKELNCDFLTVSGHKFHAPKGVGFLYSRVQPLTPLIPGHQEFGLRGGTENMASIKAMSLEARSASEQCTIVNDRCKDLYTLFLTAMKQNFHHQYTINCAGVNHCPKIISITIPGMDANTAILYLATKQIYVSAGSACRALEQRPSYVLKDLGLTDDEARQTLRISTSIFNSTDDIVCLVTALCDAYELLTKHCN